MFKPTAPQLSRIRLRLNTKQVNKGYYKGNRTGSMGAHTPHGHYMIDYRKVRTYVCPEAPEFEKFKLTPFVTKEMEPTKFMRPGEVDEFGGRTEVEVKAPDGMNGHDFLREMDEGNPEEVRELTDRSDQPAPEEQDLGEEADPEPRVFFGRSWVNLDPAVQEAYESQEVWEEQEALKESMVTNWYQRIEDRTRGKGFGGPSQRRIRA